MRNMVENGGVGMWWRTLTWNAPENGDVEFSRERLREIWRRTLTWNMVDNFDVE